MSQKSLMNALVFVAALIFGAILVQSTRRGAVKDDGVRRSTISSREYRPQLSPDVFQRVLDQNPLQPQRKNVAPESSQVASDGE